MAVAWSWTHWPAAAPLGCAVLHRETRNASVSLGLRPHSHLGHREKECADYSGLFLLSSNLCRGRGGLSEARWRAEGLKLSARSCIPPKDDVKAVGGIEGLSTEADCHK